MHIEFMFIKTYGFIMLSENNLEGYCFAGNFYLTKLCSSNKVESSLLLNAFSHKPSYARQIASIQIIFNTNDLDRLKRLS